MIIPHPRDHLSYLPLISADAYTYLFDHFAQQPLNPPSFVYHLK